MEKYYIAISSHALKYKPFLLIDNNHKDIYSYDKYHNSSSIYEYKFSGLYERKWNNNDIFGEGNTWYFGINHNFTVFWTYKNTFIDLNTTILPVLEDINITFINNLNSSENNKEYLKPLSLITAKLYEQEEINIQGFIKKEHRYNIIEMEHGITSLPNNILSENLSRNPLDNYHDGINLCIYFTHCKLSNEVIDLMKHGTCIRVNSVLPVYLWGMILIY